MIFKKTFIPDPVSLWGITIYAKGWGAILEYETEEERQDMWKKLVNKGLTDDV